MYSSVGFHYLRPEIFISTELIKPRMESLLYLAEELKVKKLCFPKTLVFMNTISQLNDAIFFLRYKEGNFARHYLEDGSFTYMVEMFSGSTNDSTKSRIMQEFSKKDSTIRILLSTVAFGMGLNVEALNNIVIYKLPHSVSTLWQEIGRAGRGGEQSCCKIFLPKNSVEHGMATKLKDTCVRKAIISNFTGFRNTQVPPCSYSCSECICSKCSCCSFCRNACPCRQQSTPTFDKLLDVPNTS